MSLHQCYQGKEITTGIAKKKTSSLNICNTHPHQIKKIFYCNFFWFLYKSLCRKLLLIPSESFWKTQSRLKQIVEDPRLYCMITRDGGSSLNLGSVSWDRDKYQAYVDLNQMTSFIWSCDVTTLQKKEKRLHFVGNFKLNVYQSYPKVHSVFLLKTITSVK